MTVVRSITGTLAYTSTKPERMGATRGREHFRIDVHADGSRTIAAHGEIDDAPAVIRDVNLRVGADRRPQECFVRNRSRPVLHDRRCRAGSP